MSASTRKRAASGELHETSQPPKTVAKLSHAETRLRIMPPKMTAADATRFLGYLQNHVDETEERTRKIADLQSQVQSLEEEIEQTEGDVSFYKKANRKCNADVGDLEDHIERQRIQIQDQKDRLETQLNQIEEQQDQLDEKDENILDWQASKRDWESLLRDKQNELEDARKQLKVKRGEADKYDMDVKAAHEMLRDIKTQLDLKADETEKYKKDAQAAHQMLQDSEKKLCIKVEEAEQHKEEANAANQKLRDTEIQLQAKNRLVEQLKKEAYEADKLMDKYEEVQTKDKECILNQQEEFDALMTAAEAVVHGRAIDHTVNMQKLEQFIQDT